MVTTQEHRNQINSSFHRSCGGTHILISIEQTGHAVRPDEVSAILKKELAGYEQRAAIYDAGTVVQVGDGIARVYGLEKVMAGELVEFPNNVMGMVLNLEEDNVGVILFGEVSLIKEASLVCQVCPIDLV